MRKTLIFFAASAGLFIATPSFGQEKSEQTPENAQSFIEKIVSLGSVTIVGKEPGEHWSTANFKNRSYRSHIFTAGTVGAHKVGTSTCESSVTVYATHTYRLETDYGYTEAYNPLFMAFDLLNYTSDMIEGTINWSHVVSVDVSAREVTLRKRDGRDLLITFSTTDLAKRVGFAMEVIRMACDPTGDDAF